MLLGFELFVCNNNITCKCNSRVMWNNNNANDQVKSKSRIVGGQDDHLGSYAISWALMRQGYRNITLQNYQGLRLTPANLFVNIHIKQIKSLPE